MSGRAFNADRCITCGKRRDHRNHEWRYPAPWGRRLLALIVTIVGRIAHLAWPRWIWDPRTDIHAFAAPSRSREQFDKSQHQMRVIKNRHKRRKRRSR